MNYGQSAGGSSITVDARQLAFEDWLTSPEGIKYANYPRVCDPRRGPMLQIAGMLHAFEAGYEAGNKAKRK